MEINDDDQHVIDTCGAVEEFARPGCSGVINSLVNVERADLEKNERGCSDKPVDPVNLAAVMTSTCGGIR